MKESIFVNKGIDGVLLLNLFSNKVITLTAKANQRCIKHFIIIHIPFYAY